MAYPSNVEYPAYYMYEFDSEATTNSWEQFFWLNSSMVWDPVLNLSNGAFYDDATPETEDKPSASNVAIVTVSFVGILVNLFFLALIIADFTVNRRRRRHLCSRHWLLLNLCVAHLVSLVNEVIYYSTTTELGLLNDALHCKSAMHILYAGPFTAILAFCLIVIHACLYVMRPSANRGIVPVMLCLFAVVLSWLATHVTTYFLVTEYTVTEEIPITGTDAGRQCYVLMTGDQLMIAFYVIAVLPYTLCLLLVIALLAFVALSPMGRTTTQNAGTSSGPSVVVSDQAPEPANRKCQNVWFICIAFLINVLLQLPVNLLIISETRMLFEVLYIPVEAGYLSFAIMAMTSMVLLPLMFLVLPEIRSIFTNFCHNHGTIDAV